MAAAREEVGLVNGKFGPPYQSSMSSSNHEDSLAEVATLDTGGDTVGSSSDSQKKIVHQVEQEPAVRRGLVSGASSAAAATEATAALATTVGPALSSDRGNDREGGGRSGSLAQTAAEETSSGQERAGVFDSAQPSAVAAAAATAAAGRLEYTVKERDTVRSIAAHFDVTPSRLKKFNRMSLDFVYPGQVIVIPQGQDDVPGVSTAVAAAAAAAVGTAKKPATKMQKDAAAPPFTLALSESEEAALDEQCLEMFVKVPACHVTDSHGAVSGTLLVTPNGIMFDPDLSGDGIRDNGIAPESMLATMKMVSSATVYRDVFAASAAASTTISSAGGAAKSADIDRSSKTVAAKQLLASPDRQKEHSKVAEVVTATAAGAVVVAAGASSTVSDNHRLDPSAPQTQWASDSAVEAPHAPVSSHATASPLMPRAGTAAQVGHGVQVPRDARASPLMPRAGPPARDVPASEALYLCLRASVSADNSSSSFATDNELYNQRKKPEHWFMVTDTIKLESIYSFLLKWKPDTGECHHNMAGLSSMASNVPSSTPAWQQPLLEVVLNVGSSKSPQKKHFILRKEWEVTSSAEVRVTSTLMDAEKDLPLPPTNFPSSFLTEDHRRHLAQALPYRIEGNEWRLVYSTELHGFSLSQLYLRMRNLEDSPILLVLQDTAGTVFGALTSCPLAVSDHFYGTGESFLFTFADRFRVYPWTGENNLFIRSSLDNLWIGTGKGTFGLYLDGDLCQGRTQHCKTYNNDPLTGAGEDFVLKHLEAWCFFS